ncbi:hypothetical protein F511_41903 [Dorcoceras hygrometricum]|uniref:Uncharacterized protein n=1 Tax=Dorcoceras hygrometricum TaxID=472368 RepID=A0A2Z7D5P4_9LAMI|nr:hypothetical protein F511_41903 [Dorcoceras hygrometricum]
MRPRLGSWLVMLGPAGPGGSPSYGAPASGSRSRENERENQRLVAAALVRIYQPAGNGAKLEPRSSSRAGKSRTSSAADKKRRRCKFSQEQIKDEEKPA